MKLLLLLSDEAQIAHRRDLELQNVQKERDEIKEDVANLLTELLRKSHLQGSTSHQSS
jgi:mediator of RNA polymerase II transcription subunit 22